MKKIVSLLLSVILMLSCACAESATASLQEMYAQGELMMVHGDYMGAAAQFDALGTYSDASQMAMYCKAIAAAENDGQHSIAAEAFHYLGDFKDSKLMAKYYEGRAYEAAGMIDVSTASDGDLAQALLQMEEALKVYGDGLAFFKDGLSRKENCVQRSEEMCLEQERRKQAQLLNASVGSYVVFGAYEQDNNMANGKEEIEWLVLARENNRLLVISHYALVSKAYHDQYVSVTWETCKLRTWLNQDFLNVAFSSEEQAMIPTVTVKAEEGNEYGPDPGNDTQDKVFLLSLPEVKLYIPDHDERTCEPTAYLTAQLAVERLGRYAGWWLRSPGENFSDKATYIETEGYFGECGVSKEYYVAVRPAMWIELAP